MTPVAHFFHQGGDVGQFFNRQYFTKYQINNKACQTDNEGEDDQRDCPGSVKDELVEKAHWNPERESGSDRGNNHFCQPFGDRDRSDAPAKEKIE